LQLIIIIIIIIIITEKARRENEETSNHSWTASPKGRCRSLECSQKIGREGLDAVRSNPCNRNYKTGGICRHVPSYWKAAEVIMIPKPGKPVNEVTSYRPILLLPIL